MRLNQKYDPEFHPKDLLERMAKGELNIEIIAAWDICEKAFYNWLDKYPEFKEAYEIGVPKKKVVWYKKGDQYLNDDAGYKHYRAIMRNIDPEYDRQDKEGGGTTNINIGNMNVLAYKGKSDTELLDIIKQKTALLAPHLQDIKVEQLEHKEDDESDS